MIPTDSSKRVVFCKTFPKNTKPNPQKNRHIFVTSLKNMLCHVQTLANIAVICYKVNGQFCDEMHQKTQNIGGVLQVFQITEFMKKLDELYQKKQFSDMESYLCDGINDALGRHDEGTALILLNELMGYYRSVSRHADCAKAAEQALALITSMGLEGTVNHGTTLLNAATGLRAAGENDRAEKAYQKAQLSLVLHQRY